MSYDQLSRAWGLSPRNTRKVLHSLSLCDFDSDYVLIRSSHMKGFYLTDEASEIRAYKKEIVSRAKECLAPLARIERVISHEK